MLLVLLFLVGALWVIRGQHGVAACDEIYKDVTARMGEVKDCMTNFDVRIIKFDTSVEIRRKLAGQHSRAQHCGCESSLSQGGGGGKKLHAWKKIAYPPPPSTACLRKKAVAPQL